MEMHMTESDKKEERYRLLCEKEVNESWSKVGKYTKEIFKALDKKELNETDLLLIKLAARAFIQKSILENADNTLLFGVDLHEIAPCGKNLSCDDCFIDECDFFT